MGRRTRAAAVVGAACAGAVALRASFASEPGSTRFYVFTGASAAIWTVGAYAAEPVPLRCRGLLAGSLAGAGAFGVFAAGVLVGRRLPVVRDALGEVTRYARGSAGLPLAAVTLANAAAEELFFRGAVFSVVRERHPVVTSTAAYALVTVATGNPALVLAAIPMGALFARLRQVSGGVTAPMAAHVVWSSLMLRFMR